MDNIIQTIGSAIKILKNTSDEMLATGASNIEITPNIKMPSDAETSKPEVTCTLQVTMPEEPTALLKCWYLGLAAIEKLKPLTEQGAEPTYFELYLKLTCKVKLQLPSAEEVVTN